MFADWYIFYGTLEPPVKDQPDERPPLLWDLLFVFPCKWIPHQGSSSFKTTLAWSPDGLKRGVSLYLFDVLLMVALWLSGNQEPRLRPPAIHRDLSTNSGGSLGVRGEEVCRHSVPQPADVRWASCWKNQVSFWDCLQLFLNFGLLWKHLSV